MDLKLNGKNAIISGSSRGIGLAIAIALHKDSELEGFADGSIMKFREAFYEEQSISIEDTIEWKKEQLGISMFPS